MTDVDSLIAEAALRKRLPEPAEARRLRMESSLSLEQVSRALGVSRTTLFEWERGRRRIPAEALTAAVALYEGLRQ